MKKSFLIFLISISFWISGFSQISTGTNSPWSGLILEGKIDSALYYANETAATLRGTVGEKSIQYCPALRNLALSHYFLGNYKKAKYFIIKEAELWESLKKTNDPEYSKCLIASVVISRKSGDYEEALIQIKKAEKKVSEKYKSDTPEYAEILYNYAGVYHDMGCSVNDMVYLKQEEKYLKKAESVYQKYGEKTLNEAIINKSDQAAWNNNIGNSPQAEVLLQQVVEQCRKEYGSESLPYAAALNNLGVLYYNTGINKFAEKYFVDAAAIYKKDPDKYRLQQAVCLSNLGALFYEMGNYKVAEELILQAKSILETSSQNDSPFFSVVLNNLASVIISQEYFASSENKNNEKLLLSGKTLLKADSVFRMNCQKPHPYSQSIISNLAVWYNLTGNRKKSSEILQDMAFDSNIGLRVVSMMNKMDFSGKVTSSALNQAGPDPVIIPITIKLIDEVTASNMQVNNSVDGDILTNSLLRMILGKATNIKKAVGPYHPAYATMLKSLIVSYASFDDVKTEEELTLEYLNVINHKTLQDFAYLSESEKELYYQTRLPDVYAFTAYSLMRKRTNPLITRYTYNNILLNKGLMLKSSTAMRVAILNSNNPEVLKIYDNWIDLQKEISVLYATPVELRTKDVTVLENQANELERILVERSQDFSDYRKGLQITWEDVKKSLKPDEAAIEFTDYRKKERDGGDAVIYCALILRNDSDYPEMIKLFDENQLRDIINKSGTNNVSDINEVYGTKDKQDEKLYDLIWKPIEEYLKGTKNIYISPSGLLYKISFPAISSGKDIYLCDKYQIQIKGSTGNLASRNLFNQGSKPSAMVFGGIQYGEASSDKEVWPYLKGTKDEGDAVNTILEKANIDVRYLTGNDATETFFKQNASKYNILHIATHGFFFGDPNVVRFEEDKKDVEYGEISFRGATRAYGVNSFVNNENPLMRSGLVLAGANDVWVKTEKSDSDDGVLTAQEVTQIDLRKNDLVVLSACETGLGDIRGSEGVYGLQRSLKMAGVKYIIMSLWEIPDKETVEFMDLFYKNLLSDKDVKEAFYKAQKVMRSKYDPYYWGAFVLME